MADRPQIPNPALDANLANDENRDLGFGRVVSEQRNLRLLNRDGSFNVGRKVSFWSRYFTYHGLLTIAWWEFIAMVLVFYGLLNLLFATAYWLCGEQALLITAGSTGTGGFLRAFFFSVETFGTIGYGSIVPSGLAANAVMTLESVTGLLSLALATGLVFARFSRPTASILFSQVAVIAPYKSGKAFEFRIINRRWNQLIEVAAKVLFTRFEDVDGSRIRKYYPLKLEREQVVFFPLSWTVVHPIDERSPLFNITPEDLVRDEAEFLILLTGTDETFAQIVHARSSYKPSEVIWNAKFVNVLRHDEEGKALGVDMDRFHDVEPAGGNVLPLPAR